MAMKIKKKSGSRGKKIIIAASIIILALGGGSYWAWLTIGDDNFKNTSDSKQTDKKGKDENKSDSKSNDKSEEQSKQPTIESEKDVTVDKPPSGETLSVWITSKNVINGTLQIRVQIGQNISSGTCTLTIGSYSTSVPVAFEPQSASCQGFDVPVSAYSGGSFTVTVQDGDKSGSVTGVLP